jgi:hypothetical protein
VTGRTGRRRHKHVPVDHWSYDLRPWCDLPTKKLCDERFKAVWDDLRAKREAARAAVALTDDQRREGNYNEYVAKEAHRVGVILTLNPGVRGGQEGVVRGSD